MNEAPTCPKHGPMIHCIVTDGDDRVLGCFWGCAHDEEGKPDYCDECADCDCTPAEPPEPVQLVLSLRGEA